MRRYVIVGMGVAAISAAETIHRRQPQSQILVISDDPFGFYSRPGLAYYLTGEIDEKQLFPFTSEELRHLQAKFIHGRVEQIDRSEHQIELSDGRRIPYDSLLLAVGAEAIGLNVPGSDLKGVFKLDTLSDARAILQASRRSKRAVVIGGGITALELVEGLLSQRVHVSYFLRSERYWSSVLEEQESLLIEERLMREGVDLLHQVEVTEILGKRDHVEAVRLRDGRIIHCDLVAYAIGVQPRISLASRAGLQVDRGILVNEFMQTDDPDIFAAGDVAQVYDPLVGRPVCDTLWNPAREQGKVAGLNMTGQETPYLRSIPFNVTRLAGITTTIIGAVGRGGQDNDVTGIARGDSEIFRALPDAIMAQSGFDINRLRLIFVQRHLLGAVVMGNQMLSFPLQEIIQKKIDISAIREALLQPNARIADVIANWWAQL